jgi:hypothetical protein
LPLVVLAMACFHYIVFSEGADVHIFWSHYFAPYFALALAGVAESLKDLWLALPFARAHFADETRRRIGAGAVALGFVVPLLMARDAFSALVYGRKTEGRFNEKGLFIQTDKDKAAALEFFAESERTDHYVVLDPNMKWALWMPWVLPGPARTGSESPHWITDRYYVTDGRFSNSRSLRDVAARNHTMVVGPFWIFDYKAPVGPLEGFCIERRAAHGLERFLVSSTHDLHTVAPDPFLTWEMRDYLLQQPNPEPAVAPKTFEQLRIAHNMAVQRGDVEAQRALRDKLLAGTDRSAATEYTDGTRLLGVRFESDASDVLTVYFESSGPSSPRFTIRSRVEAKAPGSLVPADALEWEVGLPPTIPHDAWKTGYIYSSITELCPRPGRERFVGSWITGPREPPLTTRAGAREVTLLVLP